MLCITLRWEWQVCTKWFYLQSHLIQRQLEKLRKCFDCSWKNNLKLCSIKKSTRWATNHLKKEKIQELHLNLRVALAQRTMRCCAMNTQILLSLWTKLTKQNRKDANTRECKDHWSEYKLKMRLKLCWRTTAIIRVSIHFYEVFYRKSQWRSKLHEPETKGHDKSDDKVLSRNITSIAGFVPEEAEDQKDEFSTVFCLSFSFEWNYEYECRTCECYHHC